MEPRLLGWLASVSLVFLLIVTVSVLSGYQPSAPAERWLFSALPGWGQAFATGFAAWVAMKVWREWPIQEARKNRAKNAPVVLRQLHQLVQQVHRVRLHGGRSFEPPITYKFLTRVFDARKAEVAKLEGHLDALAEMQAEIADDKVESEFREITRKADSIVYAFTWIDVLLPEQDVGYEDAKSEDETVELNGEEDEELVDALRTLGAGSATTGRMSSGSNTARRPIN